jgi:hypothetical protein
MRFDLMGCELWVAGGWWLMAGGWWLDRCVSGPFALAAIPIAAYGSPQEEWFHSKNHMNPEESVRTHCDLQAKNSVAVHWGTFQLTNEPVLEPPARIAAAAAASGLATDAFVCLQHGETRAWPLGRTPDAAPSPTPNLLLPATTGLPAGLDHNVSWV